MTANSYSGTTDHWINGEAPDTDTTDTHGENFVLVDGITGGGDILRQGLLKFDNIFGTGASRIPPGSTITDATLTLWVVNNGDSGEILRLLTEFNEGVPGVAPGDTWNDWGDGLNGHNLVPGIQATGTDPEAVQLLPLSESMFAPVPTAPLTIDVTSSLQFWSDNPGMNHGWMFREFDGNGWDFRASEHPSVSERPLLAVEFENTTDGNSVSVSIANVPPTLNAGGDETIGLDGVFNRVINFSDPGLLDVHAATVRFNDGNPAETIPIPLGDRTFTLDHTFPGAGSYTVEIDLEDDDSPPVTASFLVDVACSLTVTNTNDTGFGSLRGAIDCANLSAGTNTIDFAIPGAGPHLIQPQSALPEITDAVIIDGYTQPGAVANTAARAEGSNAVLQIVLDGSQAGANANGLTITSGGSTVAGLVIQNFEGSGIELTSVAGNHISGNFIGTDVGGNASLGNLANGIRINASSSASGGAFTETSFEDVASSQDASGIRFDDYFPHPGGNLTSFGSVSSTVFTNPTTTEAPFGLVSNGFFADGTSFFDTVDIAGGGLYGAPSIVEWTFVDPVTYVPQAVEAVAFRYGGLFAPLQAEFFDASDNQIATLDLEIDDYTSNNPVTSTSSAGFVSVDNPISKIVFSGTHPTAPQFLLGSFSHSTALLDAVVSNGFSTPNVIGTDGDGINDVAEMNVIGGSGLQNVLIFGSSSNTVIAGNLIGANASGDSSLINADVGIDISDGSGRSRIGTDGNGISDALEGNVISGNVTAGIRLRGTPDVTETIIAGNLIGTDATGTTPIANSGVGVQLSRATRTRIGTNGDGQSDAEERNVISGNTLDGVLISGLPLSGTSLGENVLAGNYIGVAADLSPLPNGTNGLRIGTDNSANRIGSNKDGTGDAAERNVIAHNGGTGILVDGATTGNTFAENSIFDNGLLGIDLGNDGTTLNDLGDTDAGPNQLQNFPVLSSAISVGGSTTISGTLDSVAGSSFTLEFFSSSFSDGTGFGEGENYVGSAIVTTNASGAANFNANFPVAIPLGHVVSATGTDMAGNTSEFSASVVIDDGDGISAGVEDGAPNGGDGNNDGTPDSQQSNVASLPNAIDGTYVTLQSPTGTDFGNVVANINPSPGDAPAGVDFPVGFFEFELSGITPGESTTVTLFLESGLMVNTYYKFGPESGNAVDHWYEFLFDGTTGAEILTDRIVLHFVDGQRGDNDLFANGVIVEPGAPGFLQNNPPTVEANADPVSVNEGDVAMNTGMFDDIDSSDNVTITASAGMITFQDTGNSGNWSWEFNSADGPIESQLVTITADDGNGGTAQANFQLNVVNLRPTVDSLSVPPDPIDFNDQVSSVVNVTFSDPGGPLDETYTCNFDMDGDSLYDMTVTGVTGTSCSTPLAYTEPGVYMVTVAVTDKDGGDSDPVTATEFIVIYDPNGGFVTGGGWIDSPANACPNFCDWAAGKASFGFVSKYHKGATVPTGRTEFQFNAGDLNFHSTSYDWLVIAGSKAIYKGDGRVNGVDGFSFQINAIDGQIKGGGGVDKFRIKIIEAGGGVIYDNQADAGDDDDPTTELGGGSIKIHK